MQKLAEICIKRPVFASVLILLLVVVGAAGFFQLGVDRFPNVDFSTVTVTINEPGASPESIETEITQKVEESVNTISGMDTLSSYSNEGVSIVVCQFQLEKNVDVAENEVRAKVGLIADQLPTDSKPPIIQKLDVGAAPVLGLAVSGQNGIKNVTEYADKVLRRRIESTPGVGQIDLLGGRGRQINVYLDAYKMLGYGVTVTDVTRALQAQNIDVPGGRLEQGARELTLRTAGRLQSVNDFANVVIKAGNGGQILMSDIGRVEDGIADAASISELNGRPTVYLQVSKQSGTNTVAVIDEIKKRVEALRPDFSAQGYDVKVVNDQSTYIKAAIRSVEEHLVVGSILAAIVVLIFLLNWRSTLIASLAIPASIIATFGLMWIMGFTLNVLTLLALTLAVGIVIDDAIVVLENIYRFIDEKGMDPYQAAIEATREIGLAVLATTLSLIAIFLPVAFMTGIVGRFMNSFGLTMAFAIGVSLVVAFTLTPTMSARLLKPTHKAGDKTGHTAKSGGFYARIDATYAKMLRWSLGHRWAIGLLCLAALFSMPLVVKPIPKGFLPTDDESQFQITARAPEGTSLLQTRNIAANIAAEVRKELPEALYTVVTIGGGSQTAARNNATIFVQLKDVADRTRSQEELMSFTRDKIVPKFAAEDLRTTVGVAGGIGGGVNADVLYTVSGPDLDKLEQVSQKLMSDLRKVPGMTDVDSSLITGAPEVAARVNRPLAAQLGVQPSDVANALNYLVGDQQVTNFQQNGEEYEVHVRAAQQFRNTQEGISLLTVPANPQNVDPGAGGATLTSNSSSSNGASVVPLSQVVAFVPQTGPSTIQRINRQRQVTIQANTLPGGSAQAGIDALNASLKKLNLGPEYSGGPTGRSREQAKAFIAFLGAFGLSLIFMYLILAAQFESWVHPITILLSLPLTVPFALISILIFRGSLNIFSLLGILVLFGVVKKNAILQIDHTNQLRERGMSRNDAILQANRDRLRPILMTTIAFVAGILPLVVSSGTGAGTNRAIGSVIFGGQTFSLLLTLLATPVAYSWFDDLSRFAARVRGRLFGGLSNKANVPTVNPERVP